MGLSVEKEVSDDVCRFTFKGSMDESAEKVLKEVVSDEPKVVFNFDELENINSLGIRSWLKFLRVFEEKKEIVFEKCTVDIIMQINLHLRFKGNGKITDFYCEYNCKDCDDDFTFLFDCKGSFNELVKTLSSKKCPKCGGTLSPYVSLDNYLSFRRSAGA